MTKRSLIKFTKALVGKYSNEEQSSINPMLFAHINIFFQPLPWSIFKEPILYSEQSYNYSPWSPYKQSLHKVRMDKKSIVLENYIIDNPIRIAGSGFMPELLENLRNSKLKIRSGCSMYFKEIDAGFYQGEIEAGNSCLIKHSGEITYVSSKVSFTEDSWEVLDEGFEYNTNRKIWGSNYGPMKFRKVISLSSKINQNYFR